MSVLKPVIPITLASPKSYRVTSSLRMALNSNTELSAQMKSSSDSRIDRDRNRKLPVLLFDIMDTVVRDPFYQDVPAFFGMTLKELIDCKHPNVWNEFERGLITEMELADNFFKDGRSFDLQGLKDCMRRGFYYLEGVEELLRDLKENGFEMHAFTNYPIWYEMIEEELKVSSYLSWSFCSCHTGKRKPESDFYLEALRHLEVDPSSCVFVDDRKKNVEGAEGVGIVGLHFKNADLLRKDLQLLGVNI
ncbi:flavin mononucleotide hydrolase 1, chloroplatic [Impatiens glandulifera]|uniref:flavin mononucleotide hydrolase 1, chloroplatic n=1 Tax=Impatiens glandulifera TaxID=253017 RepID=UPI001FB12BAC|nr:flavin mononucleotide hydrolase 1, chloroplatic [Impatiens glandulifera]